VRGHEATRVLLGLVGLLLAGCIAVDPFEAHQARQDANGCNEELAQQRERIALQQVERRAADARIEQLDAEIQRLQTDLAQAQQVIVAAESQLSGAHTRALAVRSLAEARSELEGAAAQAPWKRAEARQAEQLLADAEGHVGAGHFGAAILLASRADRIARAISAEVRAVRGARGALQVAVARANLRAQPGREGEVLATLVKGTPLVPERSESDWELVRTPQNRVGWVHRPLLEPFAPR
jgi:hypothetical protein